MASKILGNQSPVPDCDLSDVCELHLFLFGSEVQLEIMSQEGVKLVFFFFCLHIWRDNFFPPFCVICILQLI